MTAHATIDDALALAVEKFHGVIDKAGEPYILHLIRVMLQQTDDAARQVAVLHDLVEDTAVTLDELSELGFADSVVTAIDALTHRAEENYEDYVFRVAECSMAKRVKLADLGDNYRLDRVAYRAKHQHEDAQRMQRYVLSHQFLSGLIDADTYRACMHHIS